MVTARAPGSFLKSFYSFKNKILKPKMVKILQKVCIARELKNRFFDFYFAFATREIRIFFRQKVNGEEGFTSGQN